MIPIAGWASTIGKFVAKYGDEAVSLAKSIDNVADALRAREVRLQKDGKSVIQLIT